MKTHHMTTGKIKNLDSLEKEIYRLKLRQKELEHSLDKNIMGLKKNAGSMALNSIMGSGLASTISSPAGFWDALLTRILQSKKIQDGVWKLVDNVSEKIGDGIDKVASKLHR